MVDFQIEASEISLVGNVPRPKIYYQRFCLFVLFDVLKVRRGVEQCVHSKWIRDVLGARRSENTLRPKRGKCVEQCASRWDVKVWGFLEKSGSSFRNVKPNEFRTNRNHFLKKAVPQTWNKTLLIVLKQSVICDVKKDQVGLILKSTKDPRES